MKCKCGLDMSGYWCDDGKGLFEPGMLYECKCGKKYMDTLSEGFVEINNG